MRGWHFDAVLTGILLLASLLGLRNYDTDHYIAYLYIFCLMFGALYVFVRCHNIVVHAAETAFRESASLTLLGPAHFLKTRMSRKLWWAIAPTFVTVPQAALICWVERSAEDVYSVLFYLVLGICAVIFAVCAIWEYLRLTMVPRPNKANAIWLLCVWGILALGFSALVPLGIFVNLFSVPKWALSLTPVVLSVGPMIISLRYRRALACYFVFE